MSSQAAASRWVLLDVDDVLNPDFSAAVRKRLVHRDGWVTRWCDLPEGRFRLFVNPRHGTWLRELVRETGVRLAWGTTWQDAANQYVAPLLGLPRLPVAPMMAGTVKAPSMVPWTEGTPFAWIDNDEWELGVARRLAEGIGQEFLPVLVDERTGLTEEHIARVRDWALVGSGRGQEDRD
jgi:hypothetical protein